MSWSGLNCFAISAIAASKSDSFEYNTTGTFTAPVTGKYLINFGIYLTDCTVLVTGLTARVFQHEYEHLQGKLFFENVSKLKLNLAIQHAKTKKIDYTNMQLLRYALDNK